MPETMIYATARDAELIRNWINDEPDVAWIIKVAEENCVYQWKALDKVQTLEEQDYALWHVRSGLLNIPSGNPSVPDAIVVDPFAGWSQKLESSGKNHPWFGGNLPGPYHFYFGEHGSEATGSLARSGFSWDHDRYKSIGKPAHPEAKKWWSRLQRFIKQSSVPIQWAEITNGKSPIAYIFPDAERQIEGGRHRDVNRTWRKRQP